MIIFGRYSNWVPPAYRSGVVLSALFLMIHKSVSIAISLAYVTDGFIIIIIIIIVIVIMRQNSNQIQMLLGHLVTLLKEEIPE